MKNLMRKKEEDKASEEEFNKKAHLKGKNRTAVSAETYGQYNKKKEFVPKVISKSKEQINRIKTSIIHSIIFQNLENNEVNIVINGMEEKNYNPGEFVIKQGESGDCLFIVEKGDLECYKRFGNDTNDKLLKVYSSGDSFGELALLYNAPRAASVKAKTKSILWSLDRETFNYIVKDASMKKREKYEKFLKSVEILSTIDGYEIYQICDALKTCSFKDGDYVIKEGEMGDVFYIIEEGKAAATKTIEPGKPPVVVKEYKTGDYFGELALIKGDPRAANIIAKSDLRLLSLDRYAFKRLLGPIEDILKRNSNKYQKFMNNF